MMGDEEQRKGPGADEDGAMLWKRKGNGLITRL